MALNKAELTAKAKLREEEVHVGDVGPLLVRELSGGDRDAYELSVLVKKGKDYETNLKDVRAKLIQRSLIDPDTDKPMYGPDELAELNALPASIMTALFDACQRLNRFTKDDIEDLAKNSEGDPSDDSSTA